MLVPLRPAEGGAPATWAMIELQGEIERKDGGSELGPFDVGTICASTTGSVLLTIGYHQLEGKRQPLKKPVAVLSKTGAADGEGGEAVAYEVIGVVRDKYLFKMRPRALITKPEAKGG